VGIRGRCDIHQINFHRVQHGCHFLIYLDFLAGAPDQIMGGWIPVAYRNQLNGIHAPPSIQLEAREVARAYESHPNRLSRH
jgi:hypothetical protein